MAAPSARIPTADRQHHTGQAGNQRVAFEGGPVEPGAGQEQDDGDSRQRQTPPRRSKGLGAQPALAAATGGTRRRPAQGSRANTADWWPRVVASRQGRASTPRAGPAAVWRRRPKAAGRGGSSSATSGHPFREPGEQPGRGRCGSPQAVGRRRRCPSAVASAAKNSPGNRLTLPRARRQGIGRTEGSR